MFALDLKSGDFQMAVNRSDIVKTAFVTKNGTYAFRQTQEILLVNRCAEAFDAVKAVVTKAPVLKLPDFKKPFELFTDGSSIGEGAVLNREQRRVVFASSKLSNAEKNYTVTEREYLAIV
ncbi:hypothetical protein TNCV_1364011 [Trichonephila clavipes]|nr:hypothetical protein TNCV_1364011 [Trichonephila clavipes]